MKTLKDIDFSTFKEGDKYYIGYPNSPHLYCAYIGSFRKGVAIAKLITKFREADDVLINIKCEIIYTPGKGRSIGATIHRELGGKYIVEAEQDTAAPGKDYHYVDIRYTIDESCFMDKVYDYPMNVPYERGKIVRYKNTFYDLETYNVICGGPDNDTFKIDSELVDGKCQIHDSKHFKKLLVEVNNGDIIKYSNITDEIFPENIRTDITRRLKNYANNYLNFPNGLFQGGQFYNDMDKAIRSFGDKTPPKQISDNHNFQKWFYAAKTLFDICKRFDYEIQPKYYTGIGSLILKYIEGNVIIRYSAGRSFDYLYDLNGNLLHILPFPFSAKYENYYCAADGIYSLDRELNLSVYPFSTIAKRGQDGSYNIGIIDKGKESHSSDVMLYKTNLCQRKNMCGIVPDEHTEYFDLELHPLRKTIIHNGRHYTPLIKHYLYTFYDGSVVSKNSNDIIKPYRKGDTVYILSREVERANIEEVKQLCKQGSKYITNIYPYKHDWNENMKIYKQFNSSLWYMDYQPIGTLDTENTISYEVDPWDIVL